MALVEREYPLDGGEVAHVVFTSRDEGDLSVRSDPGALAVRRRAVLDLPWVWLDQVHGSRVVSVTDAAAAGEPADGLVSRGPGTALAIHTADCAPVAFVAREGVIGAAHAGWRGLVDGVLEATADSMRAMGATEIRAVLGPCIHHECYEFGEDDLENVARRYGDQVVGLTTKGTPALDMQAAVRAALEGAGVALDYDTDRCTSCDDRYYSHRAAGDAARQATLVWIAR